MTYIVSSGALNSTHSLTWTGSAYITQSGQPKRGMCAAEQSGRTMTAKAGIRGSIDRPKLVIWRSTNWLWCCSVRLKQLRSAWNCWATAKCSAWRPSRAVMSKQSSWNCGTSIWSARKITWAITACMCSHVCASGVLTNCLSVDLWHVTVFCLVYNF